MKLFVTSLIAILAATGTAAEPVSVASGDWSDIPAIGKRGGSVVHNAVAVQIADALAGECLAPGARKDRLAVRIPFLVEFTPTGQVKQVVVQNINCPRAEAALGGAVLQLAKQGEYRPTGENQVGWYRGDFELTQR